MSNRTKKPAGFKLWGRVIQGQAAERGRRDDKPEAAPRPVDYGGLKSAVYGVAISEARAKLMELAIEAQKDGDDEAEATLLYACGIVGQLSYENQPRDEDDEPGDVTSGLRHDTASLDSINKEQETRSRWPEFWARVSCEGDPSVGIFGASTVVDLCADVCDDGAEEVRCDLETCFSTIWGENARVVLYCDEPENEVYDEPDQGTPATLADLQAAAVEDAMDGGGER